MNYTLVIVFVVSVLGIQNTKTVTFGSYSTYEECVRAVPNAKKALPENAEIIKYECSPKTTKGG